MRAFLLNGLLCLLARPALAQPPVTFAPVVLYHTGPGSHPEGVRVADINGDQRPDILTANHGNSTAGVLLGQENGDFAPVRTYSSGANSHPEGLALADVNQDGRLDILTANQGSNSVGVLLGQGNGDFAAASTYHAGSPHGPYAVAVADVNGDGRLDLVTANYGSDAVGVLLGQASGGFARVSTYSTGPDSSPVSVAVADVNGDGRPDCVTANTRTDAVGVLLGQIGGGFAAVMTHSTGTGTAPAGPNSYPRNVALADVNGDGRPDILTANLYNHTAGVLLGQAGGGFAAVRSYPTGPNTFPMALAVADLNGDGRPDVVTANQTDTAGVLLGQENGGFAAAATYATGPAGAPYAVTVADVNGDGRLDIVVANAATSTVGVLLNTTAAILPVASAPASALYPNPAVGQPTLLTATRLPAAVHMVETTLIDALGHPVRRLVMAATQNAAQATVPTTGLSPGVYFVRLRALDAQGAVLGTLPGQRLSVE